MHSRSEEFSHKFQISAPDDIRLLVNKMNVCDSLRDLEVKRKRMVIFRPILRSKVILEG